METRNGVTGDIGTLVQAVLGAGESIDILANLDPNTRMGSALADALGSVTALADQRLRLRCIIHWPEDPGGRKQVRADKFGTEIGAYGWQVRTLSTPASMDLMIVDRVVAHRWRGLPSGASYLLVTEKTIVGYLGTHFDELWETATVERGAELIYEDVIQPSLPEYEREIIRVSQETWDRVISELARNPSNLYMLNPRRFEELVAELLTRDGMEVQLTQPTRDGGRDILAVHRGAAGQHLYLVECKRYSPRRPIGVDMVRALYGIVEQERATAGLLITTSRFTADALAFAVPVRYRMSLKEYSDLVAWICDCARSRLR